MIFHENRLLADDSHVISYLIFVENWGKMSQNLSSAAVVTGALRVNNSLIPEGVKIIWGAKLDADAGFQVERLFLIS